MTQPNRKDERMLDYLYGELEAAERAAFEAELGSDAALRAEVDSLHELRKSFRGLPPVTQSAESVQRMTALLMQQAAQQAPSLPASGAKAAGADKIENGGGAKVLPLRPRGLRRILTNPATGIFAAAAAALFWVVVKSQTPVAPPAATPVAASGAAAPVAVAPAPATKSAPEAPAAAAAPDKPAELAVAAVTKEPVDRTAKVAADAKPEPTVPSLREAFAVNLGKPASGGSGRGKGASDKLAGPSGGSPDLDSLLAVEGKAATAEPPRTVVAAKASKKPDPSGLSSLGALADARYDQRKAEAPPAAQTTATEAEGRSSDGLRGQVAQAQDRRREKVVEELANQELGGIGGSAPPAAAPAAAPPPPPKQDYGRYAQNQAPTPSEPAADETANSNVASAARDNSPQAGAGAPSQSQAGPQRVVNTANLANSGDAERKESASLLAAVHEQIRQGRCLEANLNLQRLEQSPATTSAQAVSEARRDWQRTCQAQLPAGNLERQLQQPMPAAQAPSSNYAPPRASAPMSKSAAPQRAKKAAPAKAKAADFAN